MKSHVRVLVIGGGILGTSLLFRLTRMGWTDIALVEKTELTAGTTWHSAGNLILLEDSIPVSRVNRLSWALYQTLAEDTGRPIGLHTTGGMKLAKSKARLEKFTRAKAKAKYLDIRYDVIGPDEVKALFPLIQTDGIMGACYQPDEGYVDPSQVTQACAHGARAAGAEIYRQTRVTALKQLPSREWEVTTDKGTIIAGMVVNAAGMWAPEIARMAGTSLAIVPTERQYMITAPVPALEASDKELPILRDYEVPFYIRQEGKSLLYGIHETHTPFCFEDGIPADFGQELLPPNLERGADHIAAGIERIPVLGEVGIKTVICGPTSRTVDFMGMMGPVSGVDNMHVLAGFSAGVLQGQGVSQLMAEWIVEGQPSLDLKDFDVNRFGSYANKRYVHAMLGEVHVYGTLDPTVEREAGRPARMSPIYVKLKAEGARFGARFGWEYPLWFGEAGEQARAKAVEQETLAMRNGAGIADLTSTAKYLVSGKGARAFLDRLCTNDLPAGPGHVTASAMVTARGGIQCWVTIAQETDDHFLLTARPEAEAHHFAWLQRNLPDDGSVRLDNLTGRLGTILVAGPKAHRLLSDVTGVDFAAFPWATTQDLTIGFAPVRAVHHNIVGETGWKLHHPIECQIPIFDLVIEAAARHGARHVGFAALESLRLEKGARLWASDLTLDTNPFEAGIEWAVNLDKGNFIGRDALIRQKDVVKRRLVSLIVERNQRDPVFGDPVLNGTDVVGLVTSGGMGYAVGKCVAFAYLPVALSKPGTQVSVEVYGELRPAHVVKERIYDPENSRLTVRAA